MSKPPKKPVTKPIPAMVSFPPEVEAKLATFPRAKQKNLRITLAKYERGMTSQWEEKKLRDAGLIDTPIRGDKAESDQDICDTHAEIASRMMLHYQNPDKTSKLKITLTRKTISDWAAGKRLSGKPHPPKPLEGVRRRWSLRTWIAWFDENMWYEYRADNSQVNGNAPAKMPIGELEEIAKRERLEHERWRIQREMGGYISLPDAVRVGKGFSRTYHDFWKNRNEIAMIEGFIGKAQSLGIEPVKIEAIRDYLEMERQKFTDAVESSCEKCAEEFEEKLKVEISQAQA